MDVKRYHSHSILLSKDTVYSVEFVVADTSNDDGLTGTERARTPGETAGFVLGGQQEARHGRVDGTQTQGLRSVFIHSHMEMGTEYPVPAGPNPATRCTLMHRRFLLEEPVFAGQTKLGKAVDALGSRDRI